MLRVRAFSILQKIGFVHFFVSDICHPGEYSQTGLFPCIPCDKSSYQNASMSTKCIECPKGMTTAFTGSTDGSNCFGMYIE
jgi:hypothetical protein